MYLRFVYTFLVKNKRKIKTPIALSSFGHISYKNNNYVENPKD